jgi:hypothetical protein
MFFLWFLCHSGASELHSHSTRLVRQREVARMKSLAFHDLTPKDIAEQLTHIDCRSLKKIPVSLHSPINQNFELNKSRQNSIIA